MKKIDLSILTIDKVHTAFLSGDFTAVDLAGAYLEVISKKNQEINAYLEVYDDVIEQAKVADNIIKSGKGTVLTGIPFAIKDNILIKGRRASSASKILDGYTATYDATVIERLKKEGAVFIGRTNMDEFAMGGSTENSAFGVTKNPYNTSRVAGGSSGGSAAAVAMDGALCALGSDTGGSVRGPASFCGLVGLKPTYGAISRHGLMSLGSSLDQIGPFGKTIKDVEIIFNCIKGKDSLDSTTISHGTYMPKKVGREKPIIGIPTFFNNKGGIDKKVLENFNQNIEQFKRLGYEVKDVDIAHAESAIPVYYIINFAEASTNLSRFDGMRYGLHKNGKDGIDDYFVTRGEGFGREVRRRILLGTYVLSSGYYDAYYNRANALRRVITNDFLKVFEKVDIIMTPTTPAPAFKIGEKASDPVAMYLEDIFTVTANLTGMPAISIPSGFSDGLPLGLQMMARHGDEATLFESGKDFSGE